MTWRTHLSRLLRGAGRTTTELGGVGALVTTGPAPRTQRLGARAWLVQDPRSRLRLRAKKLGPQTWLVRSPAAPRRVARRIGPESAGSHLVYDPDLQRADIRLFQQGLSSFMAREHAAWMLRELGVDCVLDVGANTGQFAEGLRAAGYAGRIVSFEPLPQLVAELEDKAAHDPLWTIAPYALGDHDAQTEINYVPGTMSSLLRSSEFGRKWSPVLAEMEAQPVEVRRLDGLWDTLVEGGVDEDAAPSRVYLKLDTQGYDLAAFSGAGERVRDLVAMQSEVACVPIYDGMPRMREQLAVYEDAGFSLTGMFPVTIDPESLRVIEFDAVLIRSDAVRSRPA